MRHDVELIQQYTETITVCVEADNEEEAKEKAVAYARKHPKMPTSSPEYIPGIVVANV